jgi:hypothetical protein
MEKLRYCIPIFGQTHLAKIGKDPILGMLGEESHHYFPKSGSWPTSSPSHILSLDWVSI